MSTECNITLKVTKYGKKSNKNVLIFLLDVVVLNDLPAMKKETKKNQMKFTLNISEIINSSMPEFMYVRICSSTSF